MQASTLTSSSEQAAPPARVLQALNRNASALVWVACCMAALPAIGLAWDAMAGELGPNPLEHLLRAPGRWALILLLVVLSVTPLRHGLVIAMRLGGIRYGRRLADWNWMIHLRRPLGLASFFYALAHGLIYLGLDAGFSLREIAGDLRNKPFVLAGLTAFLLLVPLALTSTDAWMRRLKRGWKRLHALIYPAAILAALHFVWLSKPGVSDSYFYAAVLAALLGYRVAARVLRSLETPDRTGAESAMPGFPATSAERRLPVAGPSTDLIAIADPPLHPHPHRRPQKE
jgi:sulfoxide reductase heme-binding subunit YedZ